MKGLGVLLLLECVLAVPNPISWDTFDRAGAEISSGLNIFGAEMGKGLEQGVNSIATGYNQFENSVATGYNQFEDTLAPVYNQFEDSLATGYNQFEDSLATGLNQFEDTFSDGYNMLGGSLSDGYNKVEDSFNNVYNRMEEEIPQRLDSWGINQQGLQTVEQKLQDSMQRVQDAALQSHAWISNVDMPDMNDMGSHIREKFTPFFNFNSFNPKLGFNNWINQRKWWEGDNICVTREELEDEEVNGISGDLNMNIAMQMSRCEEKYDEYFCEYAVFVDGQRKSYKTTYSCCRGFKIDENKICKEFDIRPVEESMASLNGADFLSFLSEESLLGDLKNSTIFLPDNDAIDRFRKEVESAMIPDENNNYMYSVDDGLLNRRKRNVGLVISQEVAMRDMLLGHVSHKIFNINDVSNDEMIATKAGTNIRMSVYNTYPKKTVLANCAIVTSKDHHTETSTIHVVDRIIKPATKTLGEILEEDSQFQTFVSLLDESDLESLRSSNGSFTVFAPSESAFQDLDELWKAKLAVGQACSGHILSTHILPTVVCSGVITGKVQVTNNVDERLELGREKNGKIYVEDREIIFSDIVGKNGVIHVISSLILPKSAQTVTQEIKQRNGQKFLDLMKKANMIEKLDEMKDFTLLMPSAKAMNEMDAAIIDRLDDDPDQLKDILLHHILPKSNIKNKVSRRTSVQESMAGINHHINHNSISCARLESRSCGKVCKGSIMEVDRLLVPPGSSILQLLESSSEHSTFLSLLHNTKLSEEIQDGHFTVFAPTNSAFESMPDNLRSRVLNGNHDELRRVLQLHIIPDIVCCSSAPSSGMFPLTSITRGHRSLAGHTVMMTRSYEGHVQANGIPVDRCDTTALNGLLHTVNKVILPRHMQQPMRRVNLWDPFSIGY